MFDPQSFEGRDQGQIIPAKVVFSRVGIGQNHLCFVTQPTKIFRNRPNRFFRFHPYGDRADSPCLTHQRQGTKNGA
jgi:hypothetical protein